MPHMKKDTFNFQSLITNSKGGIAGVWCCTAHDDIDESVNNLQMMIDNYDFIELSMSGYDDDIKELVEIPEAWEFLIKVTSKLRQPSESQQNKLISGKWSPYIMGPIFINHLSGKLKTLDNKEMGVFIPYHKEGKEPVVIYATSHTNPLACK